MLIDLTSKTAPSHLLVDVCIIGGGPAGLSIASEFIGSGRSVALLEAGFLEPDVSTQMLNLGRTRGSMGEKHPLYLSTSRLRLFGGSQVAWGGWCTPLIDLDLECRQWVPDSGWPISRTQLTPYYERAAPICGLHESTARPIPERPVIGGELTERRYYFTPGRRTAGETFRNQLAEAPDIFVCLGANGTEIRCNPAKTRVESMRARTLDGGELTVSAANFVLACGGIENARILLANGLGNDHDLAGRFFMEHPHVLLGTVHLPGKQMWTRYLERMDPELGHGSMLALSVPAETQRRYRLRNATVQLWEDPALNERPDDDDFHARLVLRAEQSPIRESRVTLGEDVDPLGVPVAQLNWEPDPADWASVCATARLVAWALREHAQASTDLQISDDCPWPVFPPNADCYNPWGCHHMGTTRMSVDPDQGVVDPDTKVHGIENLFVAGSSVFPTGGYANPTFTLIALAIRTADHLKHNSSQL
jgi:choline dehydrogenase-like flavoprotein